MFQFPISYLNSNNGTGIVAFGEGEKIKLSVGNAYTLLNTFIQNHTNKYIFGFLGYDLKNEFENLSSKNKDGLEFPDAYLWVPKYVVELTNTEFKFVQGKEDEESIDFLTDFFSKQKDRIIQPHKFNFKPRINKKEYIEQVAKLKSHIQLGNIYEINFCQEYYAENVEIKDSFSTYLKLNKITKAPFSSFIKFDEYFVFCGSPERFLKKTGAKLITEPIKGTSKRGKSLDEDELLKNKLINDPKERAENIMIVDLVRNDLSKIATKNTVTVEELCKIYSFETVHQMISRVSCEIDSKTSFMDIIKATFPMGSMTGVPKIRAMNLIEEHESFKRGLYSGSIGYIKPNGDFDFNVVIRSLLYNQKNKYLSCSVGGAITDLSDPEKEYEECLVKVKRILDGMNE